MCILVDVLLYHYYFKYFCLIREKSAINYVAQRIFVKILCNQRVKTVEIFTYLQNSLKKKLFYVFNWCKLFSDSKKRISKKSCFLRSGWKRYGDSVFDIQGVIKLARLFFKIVFVERMLNIQICLIQMLIVFGIYLLCRTFFKNLF